MMDKIIKVFGSSTVRVPADCASFCIKLSQLEQLPAMAFSKAKAEAEKVKQILNHFDVKDVRSSHIHLDKEFEYYRANSDRKLLGYRAKIEYHALTRDLPCLDDLLAGIVASGGSDLELSGVEFQTSQLKEIRERARHQAMRNAVKKADIYAHAAGATVGPVLEIKDKNPDHLQNRTSYTHDHAHIVRDEHSLPGMYTEDDSLAADKMGPGAMISVKAAVDVTFEVGKPLPV